VSDPARLIFPALRWREATGFRHHAGLMDAALREGAGGFCIFGGTTAAVAELTGELRGRSRHSLLIASDLERGTGQQFRGATSLPPLAALGALDDLAVTRRAGALTGREALAVGVNWVYAPVADVHLEARNPIVGARSFGDDPAHVARHVAEWVRGCREAGALVCAKHFPGHGRTTGDSHAMLPSVGATREEMAADLLPFQAAVDAGADSLMTAHVAYQAWDPGVPATFSGTLLAGVARGELGFRGLLVSDALNMAGALEAVGGSEAAAALAALRAGCDALLYPDDPLAVIGALRSASAGELPRHRLEEALARVTAAAERGEAAVAAAAREAAVPGEAGEWAAEIALRSIRVHRGTPVARWPAEVLVIDDDVPDATSADPREDFTRAMPVGAGEGEGGTVVGLFSSVAAWKGTAGLRPPARARLEAALERRPDAVIVLFGHPALAPALPGRHILIAWGGAPLMQAAAARWLTGTQGS
jgi:beta-glucosidase-like glycosyl hydrolase